ncbi:MAG: sulfotransferase [Promethearchaeota archaeon]
MGNLHVRQNIDLSNYIGWGWKEPTSHIYIEYINEYFPNLKYIHVIRHGLDMAYSNNQQQLYNWGYLFGVDIPKSQKLLPRASLEYWIKANKKVISFCKHFLKNKFLLINYDSLCHIPSKEIEKLIIFLELENRNINISKLCSLIKKPISTGRYKKYNLSIFGKEQIDAVRELGFKVSNY